MLQAEGLKWRQRAYARDNRALAGRRNSGTSTDSLPSPAGASPAASAAPMRLPKFARQMHGEVLQARRRLCVARLHPSGCAAGDSWLHINL